jgi:hypothetical protein
MCTVFLAVTAKVFTVALAVVAPAGIVKLAGTVATAVLELDKVTTAPPAGASPLSVTVAVELLPPGTLVGLSVIDVSAAGFTVSLADLVSVPYVAEIVTVVVALTGCVWTATVAEAAPAGIVTLLGRFATAVSPLERVITAPAGGAAPVRAIVPVELAPPSKLIGLSLTALRAAGSTVSVADSVTLPRLADIFTVALAATPCVVTVVVPDDAPPATAMFAADATAGLLLETVIVTPAAGAGPLSVAVAVESLPPARLVGLSVSETSVAACTVRVVV